MTESFARLLRQPEYIHVLLNPLPIYGVAVGLIGLVVALGLRSRSAQIATLAVILFSAISIWPVAEFGQQAYDRVLSMADEDGQAWLKEHQERADKLIPFFYALAALAALSIGVPMKYPTSSTWLSVMTLCLGLAVLLMGTYIGYAGGRIRHREFRNELPPQKAPDTSSFSKPLPQRIATNGGMTLCRPTNFLR